MADRDVYIGEMGETSEGFDLKPLTATELLRRLKPTCDSCGATLEKVFEEHDALQYDNALHIRFDGGYGEFVDAPFMPGGPDSLYNIICHDCAHALCEAFPWVKATLRPDRSHTHRVDD